MLGVLLLDDRPNGVDDSRQVPEARQEEADPKLNLCVRKKSWVISSEPMYRND
jgi:hypothetical protein